MAPPQYPPGYGQPQQPYGQAPQQGYGQQPQQQQQQQQQQPQQQQQWGQQQAQQPQQSFGQPAPAAQPAAAPAIAVAATPGAGLALPPGLPIPLIVMGGGAGSLALFVLSALIALIFDGRTMMSIAGFFSQVGTGLGFAACAIGVGAIAKKLGI